MIEYLKNIMKNSLYKLECLSLKCCYLKEIYNKIKLFIFDKLFNTHFDDFLIVHDFVSRYRHVALPDYSYCNEI